MWTRSVFGRLRRGVATAHSNVKLNLTHFTSKVLEIRTTSLRLLKCHVLICGDITQRLPCTRRPNHFDPPRGSICAKPEVRNWFTRAAVADRGADMVPLRPSVRYDVYARPDPIVIAPG